ncbi:MAG: MBL fold metallo-hydrolase [Anaerolineales bacterium]|nr:MBL fold metallo-hydrolase [Anaerolineales bacterium]
MRVKFWGVRGSIPTPLSNEQLNDRLFQALSGAGGVDLSNPAEVQAYLAGLPPSVRSVVGGNTTCVEVDTGEETIIIDCGSGMRALGLSLMAREFGRGQGVAHIFLTHAHWDHLQGYPFFTPAYVPGNRLIFYAVNNHPQTYLEHQQLAPTYFPIPPNAMPADKEFIQLREGETVTIGRTVVSNLSLYHPGTAYAYRFDDGESVFVFASDGEYKALSEAHLRRYTAFFAGADALVFDAQYSLRDVFLSKADWGHSSAIIGVDIAERARAKRLITFHHDPTHSDEQIYAIATAAREYARVNEISPDTAVMVATEGLELFLGQPPGLETLEDRQNGIWTLALAGQLNASTVAEAQERLGAMLAAAPGGRLLLDLTLLAAADPIGINGLIDTARQHGALGRSTLAVLAPTLPVRRALEQSGADKGLHIVRSRQQALAALAGPAHLRLAAATIAGQLQLEALLFVDELGAVYLGRKLGAQAPLWVRVVAGRRGGAARQQFVGELRAWQGVSHPSLIAGQAIIEADEWVALICDEPAGISLREWRARQPAWLDQRRVGEQLCEAVAAIHAHGLTHGDLHPENVVMAGSLARVTRTPLFPPAAGSTATAYHAPEQLRGQPALPASDVYALGVMLYELFLGAHPFAAETEELRLTLQLYSQPQSPRLRWPEIPLGLELCLLRLLALDPNDRPADGRAARAAFGELRLEGRRELGDARLKPASQPAADEGLSR